MLIISCRLREEHKSDKSMTSYTHYRDNAPLFEVFEDVLQAGSSEKEEDKKVTVFQPGQTYTFPFHFRFPLGTANSRHGQYKDTADQRWTVQPHHLPPTFLHPSNSEDDSRPNYAKIEYGVRARLVCPGVGVVQGKTLVDMIATTPVWFQPRNPNVHEGLPAPSRTQQYKHQFSLQTSVLSGQPPSTIGIRQSLRDRFSSSTPKLDFETALDLPLFFSSGAEFGFRATFSVLATTPNVSHIPSIRISVLKLTLLDFTFIRAPRDWDASTMFSDGHHLSNHYEFLPPPDAPFTHSSERDDFDERKTHLNSVPGETVLELPLVPGYEKEAEMQQARSCEAWFAARVPGITPPSFRSFAITRAYKVRVKLGVEVAGKKFEHVAESEVSDVGGGL